MVKRSFFIIGLLLLVVGFAEAREKIRIVGSSDILPFVQTVAVNYSRTGGYPAPSLDATGTGQGFRLFCEGVGYQHPDMVASPRPMSYAEFESCESKGVSAITEMVVGLEGFVLVNSKSAPQQNFTLAQLFTAVAEEIATGGQIERNPYTKWSEINPSLPGKTIKIMGPPPTSAVYDAFLELVMARGCQASADIFSLDEARRFVICHTIRKDGAFVVHSRNESFLVKWLQENPEAYGIARFSLLQDNKDVLAGNLIDGVAPTLENIANGSYHFARPIYLYVKTRHVSAVKGLQQFLYEMASERAIGPGGYLAEKGCIPLDDIGRNRVRDLALSLATISRSR
jgi:phosphate transport system substrate-binding protein